MMDFSFKELFLVLLVVQIEKTWEFSEAKSFLEFVFSLGEQIAEWIQWKTEISRLLSKEKLISMLHIQHAKSSLHGDE